MARNLRAVAPDETVPKPAEMAPPKDLKEAVERSERSLLVAMRRTVAAEIDSGVPAHALAPLVKQLRELDREIRTLDARASEEANEHVGAAGPEVWDATAI